MPRQTSTKLQSNRQCFQFPRTFSFYRYLCMLHILMFQSLYQIFEWNYRKIEPQYVGLDQVHICYPPLTKSNLETSMSKVDSNEISSYKYSPIVTNYSKTLSHSVLCRFQSYWLKPRVHKIMITITQLKLAFLIRPRNSFISRHVVEQKRAVKAMNENIEWYGIISSFM